MLVVIIVMIFHDNEKESHRYLLPAVLLANMDIPKVLPYILNCPIIPQAQKILPPNLASTMTKMMTNT